MVFATCLFADKLEFLFCIIFGDSPDSNECRNQIGSPIIDMAFAPNGRFLACYTVASTVTVISNDYPACRSPHSHRSFLPAAPPIFVPVAVSSLVAVAADAVVDPVDPVDPVPVVVPDYGPWWTRSPMMLFYFFFFVFFYVFYYYYNCWDRGRRLLLS
jgi:hypothetical protein